jgi:asparaginyl-tRNA synthetase
MGATSVRIAELGAAVGQSVEIRGWVLSLRKSGGIRFVVVRDGSGQVQMVLREKDVSPEVWEASAGLSQETSIIARGRCRADARAPSGVEIDLDDVEVVGQSGDYPIQPKEHGVDFLLDHRHLWLRSQRQAAIMRVRSRFEQAIRNWLDDQGFIAADTPILTPSACEGTTTLFETTYFEQKAYLSQSGQLYNEALAQALGKVYCFGPAFRAERSKTRRHLIEFWMVEPEMAFTDLDGCLETVEQMLSYAIGQVVERCPDDLRLLGRDPEELAQVRPPFPRISYDEALGILREQGLEIPWGEDFGAPHEAAISERFKLPVFVHRYPTSAKAFYMKPDPERPEVVLSADLLAPEGYGEIVGGGQRIDDYDLLLRRLREHDLPQEDYDWYLDLRRYGSVPHSGFGLGIERTLAWMLKLEHVRETIPFPRMLYRLRP